MIRNIIFDFDGTLSDTAPLILATMRDVMAELQLPYRTEAECRATIGRRLVDIPAYLWPDIEGLGPKYAEAYSRIFDKNKLQMTVGCFPGVADTLMKLHDMGIRMAIATSRGRDSVMEYVESFGLTAVFDMFVGGGDVVCGKPAPEPVLKILDALNWKADETLVVGDADVDILMGKAAGTITCAVTYGNGSRAELESVCPDMLLDSFSPLINLTTARYR